MTHDPKSSPPKFLVPETWLENLGRVPYGPNSLRAIANTRSAVPAGTAVARKKGVFGA